MSVVILRGDAASLPLPDASADAVVCDPPYGLAELPAVDVAAVIGAWAAGDRLAMPRGMRGGFMGRDWDRFVPPPAAWDECLRVLKPGGHLLAFAGARTQDLMGLSIRLAGFEIRDGIAWLFGSGFPKSLDVSKAIDTRARGDLVHAKLMHFARERGIDGRWLEERGIASAASFTDWTVGGHVPSDRNWRIVKDALEVTDKEEVAFEREVTGVRSTRAANAIYGGGGGTNTVTFNSAPATSDAALWEGWGTALKPAHEPIVVARKPLAGTVAANVLQYGTGALNVDGCRVGEGGYDAGPGARAAGDRRRDEYRTGTSAGAHVLADAGRWPPNVLLSEEAAAELDRQSGVTKSSGGAGAKSGKTGMSTYGAYAHDQVGQNAGGLADVGGASRFFPVFRYEAKAPASERPRLPDGTAWPTVKPVALMQWLVRLVTPPGGTVLDPFCGTGTTGEACTIEGFNAVLLDRDPQAIALARVRLAKPVQPSLFGEAS